MRNLLFLAMLLTATTLSAQVVVNEYSASNLESFYDSYSKTEDWIELYNTSDQPVDIGGFHLTDKETKLGKYTIPEGTIIEGNGYLTFLCSGRDTFINDVKREIEEYHTSFKLSQTSGKDQIIFTDPDSNILEQYAMDLTLVEHSRCRTIDGGSEWAISTTPSFNGQNDTTLQYMGYTVAPSMSLTAGFYSETQTVEITNNEPNSVLRYTLDGTNPIETSPEYSGPITIEQTTVVKAMAFSNDPLILNGKMDFNTYFIDENEFTVTVFSVAADSVIDLANGEGRIIPIGSIEYFNLDKEREAASFGSLNRHGQDSWILDHRSLDWISRDEMGYSKAVDAPLFSYSDREEYQRFMFRNSGDDNYPANDDQNHVGSTHIRDEYVHTLSAEGGMDLDTRAVERVVLFLNGQYWGLYGMRERPVDHDYTEYYYDQDKYNIQYLSTWGDTEAEYGGDQALYDWEEFRNFILENDMNDPDNYARVDDEMNLTSLCDYMIANLNTVAMDWLNYNTGWWRGFNPDGDHKKWGYILWDLDATFDYYINYTNIPNENPDADPCDIEDVSDYMDEFFGDISNLSEPDTIVVDYSDCATILDGTCPYPPTDPYLDVLFNFSGFFNGESCCSDEWTMQCENIYGFIAENEGGGFFEFQGNVGAHEKIFLKLLDGSDKFRQLYFSRYADMMNTVYTCENMMSTLDRMLAVIEPEMPRQIQRWGGSMQEWEQNVQQLKDYIAARCELLDDGLIECYEVTGPHQLTLMVTPEGVGEIDLNTLDIEDFPWTGEYFGGMDNIIKGNVFNEYEDDYEFSHWESASGNVIFPDPFSIEATITLTQSDTLTAVYALSTSTSELERSSDLKVFPNPTTDILNVSFQVDQDATVSIYSLIGQLVTKRKVSAGNNNLSFDLKGMNVESGMYILELEVGQESLSKKVVVK